MKIVTDSAADLTPEDLREGNLIVAPLMIQFPDGEKASSDMTPDEFYDRLTAMQPQIPTTAQPSGGMLWQIYEQAASAGDDVLAIHISSGLSGTATTAVGAAARTENGRVTVWDSLTLSGGQRFQVLTALKAIQAGWSLERILERLDALRKATEVVFTLETLTYLQRGGRIGRAQALAGSLLNLKPVIHVNRADGKYDTVGRARGIKRAIEDLARHLAGLYPKETPVWVSVLHGQAEAQAQALADLLRESLNVAKIEILRVSPVLGVHTGPGIVGATIAPMALTEVEP
jgi:DegV family protein with EDD domain